MCASLLEHVRLIVKLDVELFMSVAFNFAFCFSRILKFVHHIFG